MKLSTLPKTTRRSKKRLGRGYGSGKGGHTASRGAKGQKARSKVHLWFEGGQLPLVKRMPFQRGKGRFKSLAKNPLIVNLKHLNLLPKGSSVSLKTLIKYNIVRKSEAEKYGVKILGDGKLEKPLKVSLPISKTAAAAIKKAGGSIVTKKSTTQSKKSTTKSASSKKSSKRTLKRQTKPIIKPKKSNS